jgi:hypothetical protein
MPGLEACYFGDSRWRRMARVLEHSAREHCPGWRLHVERIEAPTEGSPLGMPAHVFNAAKLAWWARQIAAAPDGAELLLVDADVVVLRPLDDLWASPFDFAYTGRPEGARFPLNAGVVALRVSEKIRDLFMLWCFENEAVLNAQRERARAEWGGCNQAALGVLFGRMEWRAIPDPFGGYLRGIREARLGGMPFRIATLPCLEWNCENWSWEAAAAAPERIRILHVKDQLRDRVFGRALYGRRGVPDPLPHLRPLAELWHAAEREAIAAQEARGA